MKFRIGQKASFSKKITLEDVLDFARITGDNNPVHVNPDFAKKTIFGRPIVHGILCSGLISSVLANYLPGEGTIYLGQDLRFLAPVYHDEIITAEVEIQEIIKDKNHVILKTIVKKEDGTVVIIGTARVKNGSL